MEFSSERLTLTPLVAGDIDLCLELFTDPEVLKYAGGRQSETEIRRNMSNWVKRGADGVVGIWRISLSGSSEKLGTIALLPMPVEEEDTDFSLVVPGVLPAGDIEIGYFLKRSAWRQGYATEACLRLLSYAFTQSQLREVAATFDEQNTASKHVLEKVGFTDHGVMRSYAEEGPFFRITRDEWQARTA